VIEGKVVCLIPTDARSPAGTSLFEFLVEHVHALLLCLKHWPGRQLRRFGGASQALRDGKFGKWLAFEVGLVRDYACMMQIIFFCAWFCDANC